jgi:hypothetical protein
MGARLGAVRREGQLAQQPRHDQSHHAINTNPQGGGVMRLVSRSGLLATTLAIGAIGAPSAYAGGLLSSTTNDPPGAAQQEAQSFQRIYGDPAPTLFVVRPNPDQQVSTSTPPVVRPNPDQQLSASTQSVSTPDHATVARDQAGDRQLSAALLRIAQMFARNTVLTQASVASATLPHNPRVHSTATSGGGFDWGDAAIGAGGTIVLLLVVVGGARAAAGHRARRLGERPMSAAS